MTRRWIILEIWNWLRPAASGLGVLPVTEHVYSAGPSFAPFSAGAAYSVAVLWSLLQSLPVFISHRGDFARFMAMVAIYTARVVAPLLRAGQRHRLSDMIACFHLYCSHYPLTSEACWTVLMDTVVCCSGLASLTTATAVWAVHVSEQHVFYQWRILYHFPSMLVSFFDYLMLCGTTSLLRSLAADVRRSSAQLYKDPNYVPCLSNKEKEQRNEGSDSDANGHWLHLRQRQRILHDLFLLAGLAHGANFFAFFFASYGFALWNLSEGLSLAIQAGDISTRAAWTFGAGLAHTATLLVLCGLVGKRAAAHLLIRADAQRFLMQLPRTRDTPYHWCSRLTWDIEQQDGRYNIIGVFSLSGDTSAVIVGVTATFIITMLQTDLFKIDSLQANGWS
ncbi:uncharacterized protein LOC127750739 isoform X3 [Frankliniella occidentalis]|uniref:Uncharacterized protein LOC127750739 isoform X1 n=1 Tax=Frankliniella occidentalis TaxID=133901 RepID=A0A9C6X4N8_FRAOC|nr:uncharacterized protein LOC127750739 isoform X1 [Frankliniella occidentalis]XP_052129090.1 uncharacterized protein LOC127750739 isoform X2 [Frankliniella occidentalis]XP_052129091.1 uncharacterized protein LOC127750739 isoform X3 [Frankliniella occidentalis]